MVTKAPVALARRLRHDRATEAEKALWARLRNRQLDGTKFRRRHRLGPYIVDFVCLEKRLVIELDGGQHGMPDQTAHDERRTRFLHDQGFEVLRFWNNDVLGNIDGVWETIAARLAALTPLE
jgi:very-short-patch-repair endonuclease